MRLPLRATTAAACLVLVASACSGTPTDPQKVETCDGLVAVGAGLVTDYLAALQGLPVDVLTGSVAPPPELEELARRGRELDLRVSALGCDVDDLNAQIAAGVADLSADDEVSALFLEIVRSGVVSTLPPPPTTSTSGA